MREPINYQMSLNRTDLYTAMLVFLCVQFVGSLTGVLKSQEN